jgi:hypothetical protein
MESTSIPAAAAKPASLWEDFVDILYAPAQVFARRVGQGFGKPLFVLALLFGLASVAALPLTRPLIERAAEPQMRAQMDKMRAQGMSEEQVRSAQAMGERIQGPIAIASPFIGMLIGVPIAAGILFLVAKVLGARLDYSGAGLVSVYSGVPAIVAILVGAALLLVLDVENMPGMQQMSVGPALFLGRDASPLVVAVASRFGLADLWSLVVTAIGVSVVGRVSRGKGFAIAGASWLLGTLFVVALAARAMADSAG